MLLLGPFRDVSPSLACAIFAATGSCWPSKARALPGFPPVVKSVFRFARRPIAGDGFARKTSGWFDWRFLRGCGPAAIRADAVRDGGSRTLSLPGILSDRACAA